MHIFSIITETNESRASAKLVWDSTPLELAIKVTPFKTEI